MKLLFDENLAPRLAARLQDVFPESLHVRDAGLASASDLEVWNHAKERGFAIVSKDSDFKQQSFVHGHPPKVIWLRLGNCSTADIERFLRIHAETIATFVIEADGAILVLS